MLIVVMVLCLIFFKAFAMDKIIVRGNSMCDSYRDGDVIWVKKGFFMSLLERCDVVVIHTRHGGDIIKRIVGLPLETVLIFEGEIFVDGEKLSLDGIDYIKDAGIAESEVRLKENQYFVIGDNVNDSVDSRSPEIGVIESQEIIGKPFYRFLPFSRIGRVD